MQPISYKEIEIQTRHHFDNGVYNREHFIPKGASVLTHSHNFQHMSVLVSGKVILTIAGEEFAHEGPKVLSIEANVPHGIHAITDAVWMCIHSTDETDIEQIEHNIIG